MTPKLKPGLDVLDPHNRVVTVVKVVGDTVTVRPRGGGMSFPLPASTLRPVEPEDNPKGRTRIPPVQVKPGDFLWGIMEDEKKFRSKKAGNEFHRIEAVKLGLTEVLSQMRNADEARVTLVRDMTALVAELRKVADQKGTRYFSDGLRMAVEDISQSLTSAMQTAKDKGQEVTEHLNNLDSVLIRRRPANLPVREWERGDQVFGLGDILDGGNYEQVWNEVVSSLGLEFDSRESRGQDFQVWRVRQVTDMAVVSHKGRGVEVVVRHREHPATLRIATMWLKRIEAEVVKKLTAQILARR